MEISLPPEVVTSFKTTATPIAVQAVTKLAGRVASSVAVSLAKPLKDIATNLTTNFGPHLAVTYDRCTKLKTLVSQDEPVELLTQYVNLNFKCNNEIYDDFATIEQIRLRKKIIIAGTGGGGKTIFTKYLWISFFENPRGQIPIFVELRRINEVQMDDLLSLIYLTIIDTHSKITRQTFDQGIASGLFVFILDGFDEVAKEKKTKVEGQILDLAKNNPECIVIVSGRPDEAFNSWQAFSTFTVQPLTKRQVVSLIEKTKFEKTTKKKFIARIKSDLYAKHVSFLSTPLLATLMLLTFNQFADIPDKVHLFYEQAFDTLFARHDAMKESFKRDMHSGLSIDVFKNFFSYFCLVSYFEEKLEFTEPEIKRHIRKGLKIENAKINVEAFLRDLRESVCVIQRDGLHLVFTHRTFQEFFASYCLARLAPKHFAPIVQKISNRTSDSVLKMLLDMNADLLISHYLLPTTDKLLAEFDAHPDSHVLYRYCGGQKINVTYFREDDSFAISIPDPHDIRANLRNLFPKQYKPVIAKYERYKRRDKEAFAPLMLKLKADPAPSVNIVISIKPSGPITVTKIGSKKSNDVVPTLEAAGFVEYVSDVMNFVRTVRTELAAKTEKRAVTIETIFDLDLSG